MSAWRTRVPLLALMLLPALADARPVYDLKDPQLAATLNGRPITLKALDVMFRNSSLQSSGVTRADTLVALVESRLMADYARKRFGEKALVEDNKVGFHPDVTERQQFTSLIQLTFREPLAKSLQALGGNLGKTLQDEKPVAPTEWAQYLPTPGVMQLEIRLPEGGLAAAAKRVLLRYRFDDANQGQITLLDVYNAQNVQGRNEFLNRNSAYVQDQARSLVIQRYVDYWARTASGLSADDIAVLKQAIHDRNVYDGYAQLIGIAADIHDDKRYLGKLAKKTTQAEVDAYYKQHPDEFLTVEKVHARHIRLRDEAAANQVAEALAKGGEFAKLAQQYSIAPDRASGGDLGWILAADKNKEWLKSFAFLQTPGTPSRPIRTPPGADGSAPVWEIVLLDQKVQGHLPMRSSSVFYQASLTIARQKANKEYRDTRQKLVSQAKLHINAAQDDLKTDWDKIYMPTSTPKHHDDGDAH